MKQTLKKWAIPIILSISGLTYGIKEALDQSAHTLYIPIVNQEPNEIGLYLADDYIFSFQSDVETIDPQYIRTIFGSSSNPLDTPYQHYLSGGWAEVDAEMLPDLTEYKKIGIPIVGFTYGGLCKVPTASQLTAYGNFIAQAVIRYQLTYFEVWNEPDAQSGLPSLYGCFGSQYSAQLNSLIQNVGGQLPSQYKVGVSFMVDSQTKFDMLVKAEPYLDWIGVHHYGVWSGSSVLEGYPGGVNQLYTLVSSFTDKPILLTEVNLRYPQTICNTAFQAAQSQYNRAALNSLFDAKIFLVYTNSPDWQCTGIRNTPTEDMLLAYP